MRVSIERLRVGVLMLAGLLVVGILVFFVYARWRVRRIGHDLPAKLGISIQQSTNGFTFSKSQGGHTLFTLHAAKTVQYKDGGRVRLRDVSITLYGPQGQQTDRIYGDDFDYDPVNSVVRANGEVQIDLQGPGSAGSASALPDDGVDTKSTVHVTTADLVFNQKTGLASTPRPLEFRVAEAAGSATGASFDSRTGLLILEKDVDFESSLNGSPLVVRASHAQFDRPSRLLYLLRSSTDYADSHSSSDQATVTFRLDGSASRVDAQGHVTMTDETQKVISQTAHADLDARSQPREVLLEGGVLYSSEAPLRRLHGTAAEGTLSFGPQTTIRHAQLRHTVSLVEDETQPEPPPAGKRAEDSARSTTRDLQASQVDVDFATTPDRHPLAQHVLAVGGAQLNVHTIYANTPPQELGVGGDQLFVTLKDGVTVSSLRGAGHTKVSMLSPSGVKQTSTGDTLLMTFAAPGQRKEAAKGNTAVPQQSAELAAQLESSVQQGNVVLTQLTPGQGKTPAAESTATAQKATYDAATQLVNLYGNPHLREPAGDLTAAAIQFERTSGNATAVGGVKATYQSSTGQNGVNFGGSDPVHVVADHAHLDHQKDLAVFFGTPSEDARLWQGADSIAAPVLELSRTQGTLFAHGGGASDPKAVRAVLTRSDAATPGKTATQAKSGQPAVVRVTSRTLLYSDAQNQAIFRDDVDMQTSSGTIRAQETNVYFAAAGQSDSGNGKVRAGRSAGQGKNGQTKQVERIVARGDVQVEQTGRRGTGDQLVYTAQDGRFVLTGNPSALPKVVDQVHGTVTGASLIFNDRDDSVMVSGGQSKAVTETRTTR
jgi:lipopolysaccharide export system protein LptA